MSETKTTRKQLPAYLILALIALAAALLAVQILAVTDENLREALIKQRKKAEEDILKKDSEIV